MEPPHTIVLAIDGLRASALGAYGQTTYETPALDRFATEAKTYEWCFADTPTAATTHQKLAPQLVLPPDGLLVSDSEPLLSGALGKAFGKQVHVERRSPSVPASSVAETTLATTLEAWAEALVHHCEPTSGRLLAWFHTTGLLGPWDAPAELLSDLVDDEDPHCDLSMVAPDSSTKQQQHASESSWDDQRFVASCRYAAQVRALDACFGPLLELIEGLFEGEDLRILVTSFQGYALGEHDLIGATDPRLYSELQQVPLLVRHASSDRRFTRYTEPVTLARALGTELCLPDPESKSPQALLESPDGTKALHTSEWMLRVPPHDTPASSKAELFVKPDDRWEQNDVASLCPEASEQLLAMLAGESA